MRIGVVNDLALAREALRRVVASSPEHRVAWLAADGAEAVAWTHRDRPDLILMDLVMPVVNGVEATRRIMAETPCPILVVTATVSGNIARVYEAMGFGALDAIDTPTLDPSGSLRGGEALLSKIATIAKLTGKSSTRLPAVKLPAPRAAACDPEDVLVAVGALTGGPNALADVLAAIPRGWRSAVVVIQHVDAAFADGLAHWLSDKTGHKVELARDGDEATPGRFLLAGTNDHMVIERNGRVRYTREPCSLCFRPSVDVFFESAAANRPCRGVAVLLTGMGRDGASGMLSLRRAGWHTVAQDEATSVVWGMPRAAFEIGAAVEVLPVSKIGAAVVRSVLHPENPDEATR